MFKSLVFLLVTLQLGCVASRPKSCSKQTDCTSQSSVCDGHGFCSKECESDRDCPCLSFCAPLCGICIRDDLAGPATCFGQNRDMTSALIMGACAIGEVPDSGALSAADAGVDERACDPGLPLPQCSTDPPVIYQPRDSAAEADSPSEAEDAAEGDATEGGDDGEDDGSPDADADGSDGGGSR